MNPQPITQPSLKALASLFTLVLAISTFGQAQPLSEHDSALVVKHLANYEIDLNQNDNIKEASRHLNETAFIYWEHNQYQKAIDHYEKSLELNDAVANENGTAMINNNLGMLYSDIGKYQQSYDHFQKTLAARRSVKEKVGIISALINISVVLNNLSRYDESATGLKEALDLAREMNDPVQMRSCYGMLSETYEKGGDIEQSQYYFELYRTFHEMIQKEEVSELMSDIKEEKLTAQIALEKNKQNEQLLETKQMELSRLKLDNTSYDQKLGEYDSLNRAYFASLNRKQLEYELLQQESLIKDLQIKEDQAVIEKSNTVRNFSLLIIIGLLGFIWYIIFIYLRTQRMRKALEISNTEISIQKTELEDLNAIKTKLFSIISHDLKNPFVGFRTTLDAMSNGNMDTEKSKKMVSMIKRQADSTGNLLNNLLYWARTQMGGLTPNLEPIAIKELLDESIELLDGMAEKKDLSFENVVNENAVVRADREMLNVILRNILTNAVKFSHAKGTIDIHSESTADKLVVTITDHGVGMSEEQMADLLTNQVNLSSVGTNNEEGTGIGLALSKELIKLNNGIIRVTSTKGQGSQFSIELLKEKVLGQTEEKKQGSELLAS